MIQIELATGHELDALSAALELPKRDGLEADDAYRARLRAHYMGQSTTKADRELLELAAKAAELVYLSNGQACDQVRGNFDWSPLTDDGDALRLAIALKISTRFEHGSVATDWAIDHNNSYDFVFEHCGEDSAVATRRAIVRAAAEIGRRMG